MMTAITEQLLLVLQTVVGVFTLICNAFFSLALLHCNMHLLYLNPGSVSQLGTFQTKWRSPCLEDLIVHSQLPTKKRTGSSR